jgi:hypothetical protein
MVCKNYESKTSAVAFETYIFMLWRDKVLDNQHNYTYTEFELKKQIVSNLLLHQPWQ